MRKLIVLLLVMLTALPVAAQADTITDTVVASDDFTILEQAVVEAGLAETLAGGEFTVFAPRDGAFQTLLESMDASTEDLLAREDLAAILTYHVVPGTLDSTALTQLASERNDGVVELETVNGATLTLLVGNDGITIDNGAATIVTPDIAASNGVIHVIDNVLLPTMGEMDEEMDGEMTEEAMGDTIVDIATATENLSILTQAVVEAELAETLSGGEFTVFAPTNGAFQTLLDSMDASAEDLLAREDLAAILTYHVVEGTVTSEDLVQMASERNDGVVEVETVNGATLTIQVGEDGVIFDNGAASLVDADIMASNGVIHIIDNVLMPTMDDMDAEMDDEMSDEAMENDMSGSTIAEIVSGSDNFTVLAAALTEAELVETFTGEDAYTVFAPTDDAFANLLVTLGMTQEELLASDILTDILLYHVAEGALASGDVVAADGDSITTLLAGNFVAVEVTEDGAVILNGVVTVTQTDITASNGVIHVIDDVLLPQSVLEAVAAMQDMETEDGDS
jgi:transforming growth factor-beta-induced protein